MPADSSPQSTYTIEPLAVDATRAAELCGVSRALWWKLHSSGRCPAPIRLSRRCLWRVDELRAWITAGCPPRDRWKMERWCEERAKSLAIVKDAVSSR